MFHHFTLAKVKSQLVDQAQCFVLYVCPLKNINDGIWTFMSKKVS